MENFTQYIVYTSIILTSLCLYYLVFIENRLKNDDWLALPYIKEYLKQHPECKGSQTKAVTCYYCHSDKIEIKSIRSVNGDRHQHYCSFCKQVLFRSRSLTLKEKSLG